MYIYTFVERKKNVEIYNIHEVGKGFFKTKGLATMPLKVIWRLGLSGAIWNKSDTSPKNAIWVQLNMLF